MLLDKVGENYILVEVVELHILVEVDSHQGELHILVEDKHILEEDTPPVEDSQAEQDKL